MSYDTNIAKACGIWNIGGDITWFTIIEYYIWNGEFGVNFINGNISSAGNLIMIVVGNSNNF